LEQGIIEGDNPVFAPEPVCVRYAFEESGCLGLQPKTGSNFPPKLNIGLRPIANKYHEGKTKRTLERELKCLKLLKGKRMEPVTLARLLLVIVRVGCQQRECCSFP